MNDLIEFNFGEKAISIIDRNGEAWFIAKDVCEVLGLANTSKAVDNLDQDEKGITNSYTHGGNQDVLIINESGFYKLVFRSRKAIAEKFTKWVTSKVLPAIRKQGGYISSSAKKKKKKKKKKPPRGHSPLNPLEAAAEQPLQKKENDRQIKKKNSKQKPNTPHESQHRTRCKQQYKTNTDA
eukprot:TRINITY_DN36359_c0_g1_i1.p1 TRINITY_DN36359_c0_g1~~TRINITY_DN36359_c0_g1_i1.p1  ORF type:complete len:181 (-),score=28.52 TRINITY_DN36359_c0_g1_i1:20-562(-)